MRLPRLSPQELDESQREVYDAITSGPRGTGPKLFDLTDDEGHLLGPFNAMLLSPPVGGAVQELGAAIRYMSQLSARIRELAILAVAAHWDSAFERYAHEAVGRHIGLTDEELAAIRADERPPLTDPEEIAALDVVRALLRHSTLTDDEYTRAVDVLGPRRLFELTTVVGYYSLLALQLRVFADEHPPRAE